jgi:hypothetical protein
VDFVASTFTYQVKPTLLVTVVASALLVPHVSAPPASASACPSASTTNVTESVNGISRTYSASVVVANSSCTWTVPADLTSIELFVVGGGGGGGGGLFELGAGGGGGGGQVIQTTGQVTPGEVLTVMVGQGGSAGRGGQAIIGLADPTVGMQPAGSGGISSVTGTSIELSAAGGHPGGNGTNAAGELTYSGQGGSSGSGNAGGSQNWDGGGGGAGQGGSGNAGIDISGLGGDGGAGGAGVSSSFSGAAQWYAAGGGGGGSYADNRSLGTGGLGGSGVGGNGNKNNGSSAVGLLPTSGVANSGSGGGGGGGVPISSTWHGTPGWPVESGDSRERANGAAGASGVVIIRYTNGPNLTGVSTSGTGQVGSMLTVSGNGITGNPAPTATYQWQSSPNGTASWSSIEGAASNTFTPTLFQIGQFLRAELTLTNPDGSAVAYSTVIGPIAEPSPPPAPTPIPDPAPPQAQTPEESTSGPEVTSPDRVPQGALPVGSASALIEGQPVVVEDRPLPRGQGFGIAAGPVQFTLRAQTANGQRVPLAPDGSLILPRTGDVPISGDGLEPNSSVTVTLFSDPIVLGSTRVESDGRFRTNPVIPSTVPLGAHTLQLTGRTKTGDPFVLSIGVLVKTPTAALGADPVISVRPAIIKPGASVAVTARGVQAGCRVNFTIAGKRATATASKKGVAQTHIALPNKLPRTAVVRAKVSGPKCASVSVSSRVQTRGGSTR